MNGAASREQHKITAHYARWAKNYDARWARYTEDVLSRVLQILALTGRERILDVACGTGELERRMITRFPEQEVYGIDLSDDMLAWARTKLGHHPRLHFAQGDSRALAFPDAYFDIVVSCSALHYMREPTRVMAEFARVLRPGGRVVIADWCRDFLFAKAYNWIRKRLVPAHYHVYSRGELETLMQQSGLTPSRHIAFHVFPVWRMICVEGVKQTS